MTVVPFSSKITIYESIGAPVHRNIPLMELMIKMNISYRKMELLYKDITTTYKVLGVIHSAPIRPEISFPDKYKQILTEVLYALMY